MSTIADNNSTNRINKTRLSLLGSILLLLIVLLCLRYDWWPLPFNMNNVHRILIGAAAVLVLLLTLLIWSVLLIRDKKRHNAGSRVFLLTVPLMLVIAVILYAWPGPTTFSDARPEMTNCAQRLMRSSQSQLGETSIGGLDFDHIFKQESWVNFVSDDDVFGYPAGWIYSPSIQPSGFRLTEVRKVADGWYSYQTID